QSTAGRNQMTCTQYLAIAQLKHPQMIGSVKAGAVHLDAKAYQGIDAIFAGDAPGVIVQLVSRREYTRPVGILFKGKRIGKGRDIDGNSGVAIIPPSATNIRAAFENQNIIDTIRA